MTMSAAPPGSGFCEACGRQGVEGAVLPWVDPRNLGDCQTCGLLVCASCHREGGCRVCATAASGSPVRVRGRSRRPGVLALAGFAAAGLVAVVVGANLLVLPGTGSTGIGPRGAVLGERATPGQAVASDTAGSPGAPSTVPASQAPTAVRVVSWTLPVWTDVLNARHAEALFVVRNDGSAPIEVVAEESRFEVTAGTDEVASGHLDAVIPPVLQPGAEGYAYAVFALPAALPRDATASADLRVRTPRRALIELDIRAAAVETAASTLAVEGVARNPNRSAAIDGVVGAVVLGRTGRPLFALVDAASVGALEPRAGRPFRAAHPVIPVGIEPVGRVEAHGWAVRVGATTDSR